MNQVELVRRDYVANGGWETFLSYEVWGSPPDRPIALLTLSPTRFAPSFLHTMNCMHTPVDVSHRAMPQHLPPPRTASLSMSCRSDHAANQTLTTPLAPVAQPRGHTGI